MAKAIPKAKKSKLLRAAADKLTPEEMKLDTSKPRMFSDESASQRLKEANKISDLKNLGPSSEAAFAKAGIRGVKHFQKLGWKKAYAMLVKANKKNCHSIFAYALIGALKNQEWNRISEEDKISAREYSVRLKSK